MREMVLDVREIVGEKRTLRCKYSILVSEFSIGNFVCESYGVKVEDDRGEAARFPDLTVSVERIDRLMELLVRQEVTPAGLEDVIADWL